MINGKTILAIIPARGGSKGIPRKNIKDLHGKPLIAYTIQEALKSRYIDKLITSTEDSEIAEISRKYGAEVPFMRPMELASDETPGIKPILHALRWFEEKGQIFDYIICLQCTSPFRKAEQIDEAIERLINDSGDSIISICESEISPYWMKKVENGVIKDFISDAPLFLRRQDIPVVYRLNGAIYAVKKDYLLANGSFYTKKTLAYVMNRISSLDIDDTIDFKFAEFLIKENYYDK